MKIRTSQPGVKGTWPFLSLLCFGLPLHNSISFESVNKSIQFSIESTPSLEAEFRAFVTISDVGIIDCTLPSILDPRTSKYTSELSRHSSRNLSAFSRSSSLGNDQFGSQVGVNLKDSCESLMSCTNSAYLSAPTFFRTNTLLS